MNNTEHGVCIQMGLSREAEYLYLTSPNWLQKMKQIYTKDNPIDLVMVETIPMMTKEQMQGLESLTSQI